MIVFVSYSRSDNQPSTLRAIEQLAASVGTPYIDDMHGRDAPDRLFAVETAMKSANIFIGVATPNYLTTWWTRREFAVATRRKIPMLAVVGGDRLVKPTDPAWPWVEGQIVEPSPAPFRSKNLHFPLGLGA